MNRRIGKLCVTLLLCIGLTGCWDEVTIQDLYYFTAMGFSYDKQAKEYELYGQVIDVAAVAQKEEASSSKSNSVFGHEKGESPSIALDRLFKAMQMNPVLDHMMTVLLDESSIANLDELLDGINRNSAIRYTINVLGSENPIGDMFQTTGRISTSPLNTNIYQPNSNKRGLPFTTNNDMRDLVRAYKSCPCTVYIPKLKLNENHWVGNDGKRLRTPIFDGAFVLNNGSYAGKFTEKQLEGARWFMGSTHGQTITLKKRDRIASVLQVKRSSNDYHFGKSPTPSMKLKLRVRAILTEYDKNLAENEIQELATKEVIEQIESTLRLARSRGVDLFNFEGHIYRYHHARWKKMKSGKTNFAELPVELDVKVHLIHSGKMKMRKS
ncbi:Ger(x)C family spore germination protein [Cohnella thailandensis]|uniref:Ger(X)C family spore germination protein n=1 Tax=Cohnella thailandensis TaxID=557557 RepID=A0A841T318_9BACL|nr:Ger(x)C family spore germination protein [Cohnella thailandensis]MBB6637005.1 Ger(x)C family spore germination protein [Cohnella thailandensis]MBP1973111.1 Ger(x)C family germination protein [Cohnella thailandensis]